MKNYYTKLKMMMLLPVFLMAGFITTSAQCLNPTGIALLSSTSSNATFTFTASTSMPLGYFYRVTAQGTGVNAPAADSGGVSGAPFIVSFLSPATQYTLYLRSFCAPGDTATTSVSFDFQTQCAAFSAPYTHDVETQNNTTNSVLVDCWSSNPTNSTSTTRWNVGGSTSSSNTGPTSAHSGSKFFFLETSNGSTGDTAQLFSPIINVSTLTSPFLQFWYHMNGATITRLITFVSVNGGPFNAIDSIVGEQQTAQADPFLKKGIALPVTSGNIQIKFEGYKGTSFTGDIAIDDFAVIETPSCVAPGTPSAFAQGTSATFSWMQSISSPGLGYEWRVFAAGNGPTGTSVTSGFEPAGDTMASATGLTSSTNYTFYVRSICGAGDTSQWTSTNFFTECANPTGLALVTAATTGATFSFANSASAPLGYFYRVTAQGAGVNAPAADSGAVSGSPFAVSSLMSSSQYTVYIRSFCSPGDTAGTYESLDFQTLCVPFTAPYTHDVESQNNTTNSELIACWTSNPTSTTSLTRWNVGGSTSSSATGPNTAHSGSKFFFLETSNGSTGDTAQLLSPIVDITSLSAPLVSFWYHMNGATITKLVTFVSVNGGPFNAIDSIVGEQQTAQADPFLKQNVPLTGLTGNIQIKFEGYKGTSFTGDIAIDDISIIETPSCVVPGAPMVVNTQGNNAMFSWDPSISVPALGYEWKVFTAGTGTTGTPVAMGIEPAGDTTATVLGLTAGTSYTFYVRSVCGVGDTSIFTFVNFDATCENPTGLTVSSVTLTGATVAFGASSSNPLGYAYRVVTGTNPVTASAIDSGFVTTSPITVSNLMPSTPYTIYVATVCSPGDTATSFESTTLQTPCTTIPAPYIHDVESQNNTTNSELTACWTSNPTNTTSQTRWNVGSSTPSSGTGPTAPHSGSKFFFLETSNGSTGDTAQLFSPIIDVTSLSNPIIEFWYHMNGATITSLITFISVNSGPFNAIDSIVGEQQLAQGDPFLLRNIPLTGVTGNVQVKFEGYKGTSFTGDIAIDDFAVIEVPTCLAPTGLAATNGTASGATVTWNSVAGATAGYEYVVDQNATPPAGMGTPTLDTFANVTGLSNTNVYYLHVRTNCGIANGYSMWSTTSFLLPISNDNYCGATDLIVNDPAVSFVNTTNATIDPTDPTNITSCTGANNNVWYKFTTSAAGVYNVNSFAPASGTDNMSAWLWLYTAAGTCPGTLTFTDVADLTNCSVAAPASTPVPANASQSYATPSLAAATTYYLFVDGNSGSFGNIGFNISTGPLAIHLLNVSATNDANRNRVDWNTASEDAGDVFTIQRSADGRNFSLLDVMNAKGTGSTYSYWDNNPVAGVNYYRLKMTDAAQQVTHSKIVTATVKTIGTFTVEAYPNPVHNVLNIKVYGTQTGNANVRMMDITGKTIQIVNVTENNATVNMNGMANGIYFIKYIDDNHQQTIKINKQ